MNGKQLNIVLNDQKDLHDLLNGHRISLLPREGDITLELEQMSETERIKWQDKLKKYYFACGCKEGSLNAVIFFILFWTYILFFVGVTNILNWQVWGFSIIALILGALFGKTIGLIYSRYALMIAVRKLVLAISQKTSAD
ncbi:MAG: hypothetical protein JSW63_03915 [Ignavibacterium sp.]|nr:MAG: hypothetical protein JSW63_03915 [Ignavibacterium sp.]